MFQYGDQPRKSLSSGARKAIAELLHKNARELQGLFTAVDEIITAYSPQAKPLIDPGRLRRVRSELSRLRKGATALHTTLGAALTGGDEQVRLRLLVGLMFTEPGNQPLKDFPAQVGQFRKLVDTIDTALAPRRGGAARSDHLRMITYLCAVQYRKHLGEDPARRPGGRFHRMMILVLNSIDLKLPKDPYSILKPAVDLALSPPPPPEQTAAS
jgi:hypothetical protein